MNTDSIEKQVWDFFKTLVDVDRLRIAGLLGCEALSIQALSERLRLRPKIIMNHLERLVALDLVCEQEGLYQLNKETLERLARQVLAGSKPAPVEPDYAGDEAEMKVLRTFISSDGRIKAFPLQSKKMLIILKYVWQAFEPGKVYSEKEVNEILRRFNEDTATLRRGLVDYQMLKREKGTYWRLPSN